MTPTDLPDSLRQEVRQQMPQDVLRDVFGYAEFRGQQAAAIDHVCDGHDALVLMPTGGGKSLCYQIPALVLPGLAADRPDARSGTGA